MFTVLIVRTRLECLLLKNESWDASFRKGGFLMIQEASVRRNVLFRFFSFGSFYVTLFLCASLSLIGLTVHCIKHLSNIFLTERKILFAVILLPKCLSLELRSSKRRIIIFCNGIATLLPTQCGLAEKYTFRKLF